MSLNSRDPLHRWAGRTRTSNLIGSAPSQRAECRSRGVSSVRIQGTIPNEPICGGPAIEARAKGLALEARRCGFEPRLVHNSVTRLFATSCKEVNSWSDRTPARQWPNCSAGSTRQWWNQSRTSIRSWLIQSRTSTRQWPSQPRITTRQWRRISRHCFASSAESALIARVVPWSRALESCPGVVPWGRALESRVRDRQRGAG